MRKTKVRARTVLPFTDLEQLGYETALQSRDQAAERTNLLAAHPCIWDELQTGGF